MTTLTHHDTVEEMSGDTWTIDAQLQDYSGQPLTLTDASLIWVLINPDGERCPDINSAAVIEKLSPVAATDPNARITVPASATAGRLAGRYTDAMRVVIGDEVDLMFTGIILVSADPFAQPSEGMV